MCAAFPASVALSLVYIFALYSERCGVFDSVMGDDCSYLLGPCPAADCQADDAVTDGA